MYAEIELHMAKKSHKSTPFVIHNIFSSPGSHKRDPDRFLIVAHRDIDGLISAYFLAVVLREIYPNIDVVFSQPYMANILRKFLVHHNQQSLYTKVAFVDLSIDCTKPNTTRLLIKSLGNRLEYLFDHHIGWEHLLRNLDLASYYNVIVNDDHISTVESPKYIIIGNNNCCAEIIYQHYGLAKKEDPFLDDLLLIAMLSDDLNTRKLHRDTEEYNMFINFKNNSLENCLELLKGNNDLRTLISPHSYYTDLLVEAIPIIEEGEEIHPGILYIKTFSRSSLNYTAICEAAYSDYNIVIIKELDPKKLRLSYMVAHNIPGLDLVRLFELGGGNPKRVTLYKKGITIHDIVEKLSPYSTLESVNT